MDWLTDSKIPVGKTAKAAVDWLIDNLGWVFDAISDWVGAAIEGILWVLQGPHPLISIAIVTALTYFARRKIGTTLFVGLGLLAQMVGWRGLEPRTNALKGHCSTN